MFPLLQLGPFALQVPGLILIISLMIGANLSEREAKRQGQPTEDINNLWFYGLLAGILGARLGYVARYFDTYLADPRGIISLNPSTLDLTTGAALALAAMLLYGYRKKLALRPTLDQFAPMLAVLAIGVALANLASGNAFGSPTSAPWAIYLWDANRHPTQIYEALAGLLILLVIWRIRGASLFPGFLFLSWLALTAGARLFLEAFRGDSALLAGGIRQAQLAALAVLLVSLWLMKEWSET